MIGAAEQGVDAIGSVLGEVLADCFVSPSLLLDSVEEDFGSSVAIEAASCLAITCK
jgi:hypothetical protein